MSFSKSCGACVRLVLVELLLNSPLYLCAQESCSDLHFLWGEVRELWSFMDMRIVSLLQLLFFMLQLVCERVAGAA